MNRKTINKILLILSAIVFICSAFYIGFYAYNRMRAENEYTTQETVPSETEQPTEGESSLIKNPVDFSALQQKNDEIYAWLKIEDTKIDYPVVQHSGDDAFYLTHSGVDKSYLKSGAIYTEKCNSLDFSDPVTLVYGHNNFGDTMFTTLHKFEKKDFFDTHKYFHIYLPQRRLTYQLVSAFRYDDRHIMLSNDFSNKQVLQEFQQMIQNPLTDFKNVNTELDAPLDENSKIVVLSTCITNDKASRYLVCAVLVKDEETE